MWLFCRKAYHFRLIFGQIRRQVVAFMPRCLPPAAAKSPWWGAAVISRLPESSMIRNMGPAFPNRIRLHNKVRGAISFIRGIALQVPSGLRSFDAVSVCSRRVLAEEGHGRRPCGPPEGAVWIDLVNPTAAEDRAVERLCGIAVPTREDMQEMKSPAASISRTAAAT